MNESQTFEVDIHCCQGERDRSLGFAQAWIQDILIGENDSEYLYSILSPSKIYAASCHHTHVLQVFLPQRLFEDLPGRCHRLFSDHTIGK